MMTLYTTVKVIGCIIGIACQYAILMAILTFIMWPLAGCAERQGDGWKPNEIKWLDENLK